MNMKEPTYEDVNGDVAKYLILLKQYCEYLKKENTKLWKENAKLKEND